MYITRVIFIYINLLIKFTDDSKKTFVRGEKMKLSFIEMRKII